MQQVPQICLCLFYNEVGMSIVFTSVDDCED